MCLGLRAGSSSEAYSTFRGATARGAISVSSGDGHGRRQVVHRDCCYYLLCCVDRTANTVHSTGRALKRYGGENDSSLNLTTRTSASLAPATATSTTPALAPAPAATMTPMQSPLRVSVGINVASGTTISHARRLLSDDGRTMTVTQTGIGPNGEEYTNLSIYEKS